MDEKEHKMALEKRCIGTTDIAVTTLGNRGRAAGL